MNVDQYLAWAFYGLPESHQSLTPTENPVRPVGEVGYVVGWISDQLSRLEWRVEVDGKQSWVVDTPDGDRIRSTATTPDPDSVNHPVKASSALLDLIGWGRSSVKQITTNLFVAGECHYVHVDDQWQVVSVVRPKRQELVDRAGYAIRALWPHPADPTQPDGPLMHALTILTQLDWLTRLSEAQSSTRIGQRGVVGVADSMATASGRDFWTELNEATQQNMSDPSNLAPVVVRGPDELVAPSGSGMQGFSWVVPEFPYDERVDEKIAGALTRLAYALPVPPEVMKGMQAQSRATAFQVEASAYAAHIEPPAHLVARVAEEALTLLLGRQVRVLADPTNLLARRHSVSDVLEAFDRGATSLSYLRSVLGIPEHAAATEEDLEVLYRMRGRSDAEAAPDPADVAAQDPFPSQQSLTSPSNHDTPAPPTPTVLTLRGATQQACDRARERVGAKARTHPRLRNELAPEVPNALVAAALGVPALVEAGVRVRDCVEHAVSSLTDQVPSLTEPLVEHVLSTLECEESLPLPDTVLSCLVID